MPIVTEAQTKQARWNINLKNEFMQERNNQTTGSNNPDERADRTHGMQGIDKAPGEEPSQDNVQFQQETQKAKKVDADVTMEQDRPAQQNDPNL